MIIFIYLAFVLGCRRQARKACSLPFFAVLCAFLLSKRHFAPVLYFSGRPQKIAQFAFRRACACIPQFYSLKTVALTKKRLLLKITQVSRHSFFGSRKQKNHSHRGKEMHTASSSERIGSQARSGVG